MATELAKAYVQVIPSAQGISTNLQSIMDSEASKAGTSAGNKFTKMMSGALSAGMKVAGGAVGVAATALVALTDAMVSGAKETAAYGDNVDKLSQKIGISAGAFQEWDYVFSQNGADIGILETGMKKLATTMADAKAGSDTAISAFNALGLSVEELSGLSQEDLFSKVIASLQEMPEGAERTAAASDLLGRSAMELGPLLNQSAEATEALKEKAHDLGMVMSDESVKASAAFTDSMDNLSRAFQGAKNGAMAEFLPGLTDITNGLANLVAGNEGATEQLTSGFEQIATSLQAAIPNVLSGVTSLITAVASAAPEIIQALADGIMAALPQLTTAVIDIVPQIIEVLLALLPQLAEAGLAMIGELANGISESLPTLIPALVDVVMNIVQVLVDNIPMLIDAAIQLILGLAEGLIQALPVLIEKLPELIQGIVDGLIEALPMLIDGVIQLVTMIAENLPTIIQSLVDALPQIIEAIVQGLITCLPMLIEGAIQLVVALAEATPQIIAALIQAIPQIIEAIITAFADLGPALIECFSNAFAGLSTTLGGIAQSIVDAFRSLPTNLANLTGQAVGSMITAIVTLPQKLQTVWTNVTSAVKTFAQNFANAAKEAATNFAKSLVETISQLPSKMVEIGRNIVAGIKQGIMNAWDSLKKSVTDMVDGFVSGVKEKLKIESPSKVMANEVGRWIPAGIAMGIENGMGVLNDEIKAMTNQTLGASVTATNETLSTINYAPTATAYDQTDNRALLLLAEYLPVIAEGMNQTIEVNQNDQGIFSAVRVQNRKLTTATGYHALA